MPPHTTNYSNTFIAVSPDTKALRGEVPGDRTPETAPAILHRLLLAQPYGFTSDELLFRVHAIRHGIAEGDLEQERDRFFAKGQACLRASPLAKTYGWGFHFDSEGRVALVPMESDDYSRLNQDSSLTQLAAMRSSRKG